MIVYDGDDFEYETVDGYHKIIHHKQKLGNIDNKILGAYAIAHFKDGRKVADVMSYKQIQQSWKMSQTRNGNKLQDDFSSEAAKRTVINRALKPIINTSSDANLYQREDDEENEVEETTYETVASQLNKEKKVVALPAATPKETIPVQPKPEPVKVEAPRATAQAPKTRDIPPDSLFESNVPNVVIQDEPEEQAQDSEEMGEDPEKW